MNCWIRATTAVGIVLSASAAPAQEDFGQCRERLAAAAVAGGISRATATSVLDTVEPLERVISADRNQAEFVQDFATYLAPRVSATRVTLGRALYATHRALLDALEAKVAQN